MLSMLNLPPFDAGIGLLSYIFGPIYALIAFGIVTILEAWIMRKHFTGLDRKNSLRYSLTINLISTIVGIPYLFLVIYFQTNPAPSISEMLMQLMGYIGYSALLPFAIITQMRWILIAFGITILVEFLVLIRLLKPRPALPKTLKYILIANSSSYLAIFLIPVISMTILFLVSLVLHQ